MSPDQRFRNRYLHDYADVIRKKDHDWLMQRRKALARSRNNGPPGDDALSEFSFLAVGDEQSYSFVRMRGHLAARGHEPQQRPPRENDLYRNAENTVTAGLSISGGGIRTATLSLGVMQALAHDNKLRCFDFLSTVSGGGYLGGCLVWLYQKLGMFPFGKDISDARGIGGVVLAALRSRGKFLTPGNGIGGAAMASALFGATLVNLVILVPVFLLVLSLLDLPVLAPSRYWPVRPQDAYLYFNHAFLLAGAALAIITLLSALGTALSTTPREEAARRRQQRRLIIMSCVSLALLYLGAFPYLWKSAKGLLPAWLPVRDHLYAAPLLAGIFLLAAFVLLTLFAAFLSPFPRRQQVFIQRRMRRRLGALLATAAALLALGLLPALYDVVIQQGVPWITSAVAGTGGMASILFGRIKDRSTKSGAALPAWSYRIGTTLVAAAVIVLMYGVIATHFEGGSLLNQPFYAAWLAVALVLGVFADINNVSMHRYYRNRLLETYMPDEIVETIQRHIPPEDWQAGPGIQAKQGDDTEPDSDAPPPLKAEETFMHTLSPEKGAPLLIINTTAAMTGSEDPVLNQRCGINYVFTPRYNGSDATQYWLFHDERKSQTACEKNAEQDIDLATAMAISGAAVNPNSRYTRSMALNFLMVLLNFRLGYWFCRPAHLASQSAAPRRKPLLKTFSKRKSWFKYTFKEMFGIGLDETSRDVHLSDGGHFENLGAYELIRRRCKYIVIIDGAMDKDWEFKDLAWLIELARVDFGVKINLCLHNLRPARPTSRSPQCCVVGSIDYRGYTSERDGRQVRRGFRPCDEADDSGVDHAAGCDANDNQITEGKLLYIKNSLPDFKLPELESYQRQHPRFPHEATSDLFFDETQFEAYRELGYSIGRIARGEAGCNVPGVREFWRELFEETGYAQADRANICRHEHRAE